MTENLGDFLKKYEEDHAEQLRRTEERKTQEKLAEEQKNLEFCKTFLEELKIRIPEDIKNKYKWNSERKGITYILDERRDQRNRSVGTGHYVKRVNISNDNYGTRYVLYNEPIWDDLVSWGKELGLSIALNEEGHSESRGEEGWHEHDYWYILVKAL